MHARRCAGASRRARVRRGSGGGAAYARPPRAFGRAQKPCAARACSCLASRGLSTDDSTARSPTRVLVDRHRESSADHGKGSLPRLRSPPPLGLQREGVRTPAPRPPPPGCACLPLCPPSRRSLHSRRSCSLRHFFSSSCVKSVAPSPAPPSSEMMLARCLHVSPGPPRRPPRPAPGSARTLSVASSSPPRRPHRPPSSVIALLIVSSNQRSWSWRRRRRRQKRRMRTPSSASSSFWTLRTSSCPSPWPSSFSSPSSCPSSSSPSSSSSSCPWRSGPCWAGPPCSCLSALPGRGSGPRSSPT
mmetsp:Transcript_67847/g.209768  ORF Transcript_67847/g.209768 Transcript_67847/m.209768 type:complete len:302 (+) Transcript_67847:1-906(+)